ncbi:plasmid mobilization protein [Alistipes timonensis]|uniref:plasmid mobilization protein n=1 Tax=Alistipes timonensis TaxID=1465754 RepID=UPI001C3D8CBD|nr:plasmid mobilization relaxosome protein MobC [Alistipes timonensis]MCR2031774.1 MobC family plasmid mobilization relaxosome protein [Alistipes timonensis]
MKHPKHTGGRPPLSKARKQEYRITLRLDTEHKLRLQALARTAGRPRTEVLRQLIAVGRVRERLRREHLDFMSQLKGMARNLNQLTRLAHAKGLTGIVSRHATIVANIEILLKHLRDDR